MKKIIAKYSLILLAAYILHWALFELGIISIPSTIPYLLWSTSGTIILIIALAVIISLNKTLLIKNGALTVVKLTAYSMLAGFCSEFFFQIIRQTMFSEMSITDRLYAFASGTLRGTFACGMLAFFVAFQLKTKRAFLLIAILLVAITIVQAILKNTTN